MFLVSSIESLVFEYQDFLTRLQLGTNFDFQRAEVIFRDFCASLPTSLEEASESDYHGYYEKHSLNPKNEAVYREVLQTIAHFQVYLIDSQNIFSPDSQSSASSDSTYSGLIKRFSSAELTGNNEPWAKLSTGVLNDSFKPLGSSEAGEQANNSYLKPHRRRLASESFQFAVKSKLGVSDEPVELQSSFSKPANQQLSPAQPQRPKSGLYNPKTSNSLGRPKTAENRALDQGSTPQRPLLAVPQQVASRFNEDLLRPISHPINQAQTPSLPLNKAPRHQAKTIQVGPEDDSELKNFFTNQKPTASPPLSIADEAKIHAQQVYDDSLFGENLGNFLAASKSQKHREIVRERNDPDAGVGEANISFSRLDRVNSKQEIRLIDENVGAKASLRPVEGIDYKFDGALSEGETVRNRRQRRASTNLGAQGELDKSNPKSYLFEGRFNIDMLPPDAREYKEKKFNPIKASIWRIIPSLLFICITAISLNELLNVYSSLLLSITIVAGICSLIFSQRLYLELKRLNQGTPISTLTSYVLAIEQANYVQAYRYLVELNGAEKPETPDFNEEEIIDYADEFNAFDFETFCNYWKVFPHQNQNSILSKLKQYLRPDHPKNVRTVFGTVDSNAMLLLFENTERSHYFLAPVVRIKGNWFISNGQILAQKTLT